MKLDPKIKAVCFDAFGTLVEIKDKRRSHAALLGLIDMPARDQLKHAITLRPHINELWASLRAGGYKIALCSNQVLSYGSPLLKSLPGDPDALILSYEAG